MFRQVTVIVCILIGAAACQKSGKETQDTVDNAQTQANTEITNAQIQAADKTNSAQATADKKTAGARLEFDRTREDYRHDMQMKLDTLDKDIADLGAKARVATGKNKLDLDAKASSLRAKRDAFAADVRSLANATPATFDATKVKVDKEWSDIKSVSDSAP